MKIAYKNLTDHIKSNPSINEISKRLLQLGHEHEIENNIFDMEYTPNRGDCLSVIGLLRDLSLFYDVDFNKDIYEKEISNFILDFNNFQPEACPQISFLKVEIEDQISPYKSYLNNYFNDLGINKNNFFTDISNYISYELGQPTHCYDLAYIDNEISLDFAQGNFKFQSLLNKEIQLKDKNLVFTKDKDIINLAGVMGGKDTSCSSKTKSVLIECAYFNPEDIIGKSIKYDIQSDAAHKFERGVDPLCHDFALRRFLQVISDHSIIKNVEIFTKNYLEYKKIHIPLDVCEVNKILGTAIESEQIITYLSKLGFNISNNIIEVPSYRFDIKSLNDIAEEIARAIGYDNIPVKKIDIPKTKNCNNNEIENSLRSLLVDNGFYEVINNPFVNNKNNKSIQVDNPLDSNKRFLRTNLRQSLIDNLLYNERRQKDSVKLFEISNIYSSTEIENTKRTIGIIASGVVGKNYVDFIKKIDDEYLLSIIGEYIKYDYKFEDISRKELETKLKNKITYLEINIDDLDAKISNYEPFSVPPKNFIKYVPISEFPSSSKDLSFLVEDFSQTKILEKAIFEYENNLLKDVFIFDFYKNEKMLQVKMAFRFIFQSQNNTITSEEINIVINEIIELALKIPSISIPGLQR